MDDIKPKETKKTSKLRFRPNLKLKMNKKVLLASFVVFCLFSGVALANNLVNRYVEKKLTEEALEETSSGNYSAALVLYDKLKEKNSENNEVEIKIESVKKLFIAEENFLRAKEAAEKEDWISVEVLLKNSEAVLNEEFKFYEEAVLLYGQSKDLISSFEEEVSYKINNLRQAIKKEETKREQVERSKSQIESALQQTSSQKKQTEEALQSTQTLLQQSQNKINETQAQIEAEQRRAEELERQAEMEKLEKLSNEMQIYVGMLKDGNDHLNSAISEIDKSNDVAAFTFVSRARDLFNDAKEGATDLYENRTPYTYQTTVNNIVESADLFNQAVQNLSNAIVNIGSKEGSDFNNYYNNGKSLKIEAYQIANSVPVYN